LFYLFCMELLKGFFYFLWAHLFGLDKAWEN